MKTSCNCKKINRAHCGRINLIVETPILVPYVNTAVTRLKAATGIQVFAYPRTSVVHGAFRIALEMTPQNDMNGYYNPNTKRISIHPLCTGWCLRTNILHEMGHMLGARHVAQGTGIMSPEPGAQRSLTLADLDAICLNSPNPCTKRVPETL